MVGLFKSDPLFHILIHEAVQGKDSFSLPMDSSVIDTVLPITPYQARTM
jgi:hypothetical protein